MKHTFKRVVQKQVNPSKWNRWVSKSPFGSLFQTTYWADRLVELFGYEPRYLALYDRDDYEPVAVLLYFRTTYGHLRFWGNPFYRATFGALRRLAPVYLWHGGPIIIHGDQEAIVAALLTEIERQAKIERVVCVQPSELTMISKPISINGWNQDVWATYRIDLRLDEESLWHSLKKSARKAVRRAQRDNITIRKISSLDELRDYYKFAEECAKRLGKRMYGFADIATMWKYFHSNAILEIFEAYHQGKRIGGLGIWGYNGIISEFGAFQSAEAYEKKLYGQDLIKWEVIRWGHQQGFRWFDLAGVNPNPQTPKERGIRQFKEKWGGRYFEYPIVSKKMIEDHWLLSSVAKAKTFIEGIVHG